MPTNQPTELSDAMLRELLLLLEQGISPGRLRPEAINVTRALLGSRPDGEGVFGNIPVNLRRPQSANEPSYAREVLNAAEEWLGQTSLPNHPAGLSLGCFPAGIESGCRKHLECPTEIEKNCPFRDKSAADELEARQKDPEKDVMPVLRRCQFLGCVRPERARKWVEEQRKQNSLPVLNNTELNASQSVKELTQLGLEGKGPGCSSSKAALHTCLDSLCPHFGRSWKEPIPERSNELEGKNGLNQHRFLQCSLSRPWPVYGFDPAKPATMRHFDDSGLPIEFGNMLRGLDRLPRPRGFMELPVLWLRRAGFSGVGVVVVDEMEKKEGVYYLQMGSTEALLRDYYEMPYFWLGEQPGKLWPDVIQKQLSEGRLQYIQCLFRGHRQAAAAPADWKPELIEIFRDSSAKWLAPFGRGRFLYCPDGEISFFLLCMRLLRMLRAIAGGGKSEFEEKLLIEFQKIASKEIWMGGETDKETAQRLPRLFHVLLNLHNDGEPSELREELVNLGLMIPGEQTTGDPWVASETDVYGATPRLRSLVAWLQHFHQVCGSNTRTEHFIPTEFLLPKAPEGLEGWFSLRDVVSRIGPGGDQWKSRAPLPECVSKVLGQLDDVLPVELNCPVGPSAEGFSLRGIVAAIMSVVAENLGEGTDPLPYLEKMILQTVRRGRFPLAGYYAWRSSGNRDFCLGHFAVPIGQGNPVTAREEEGQVPWREDQFFLAGIDECLLSGVECDHLFQPLFGGGRKLARGLENVALLGRTLFSPLADSTINYTIFQKRLQNLRSQENRAAEFRAHQMNSLLGPMKGLLKLDSAWEEGATREQLLKRFRESLHAIHLENSIYLDVAKGTIGSKGDEDEDYRKHNVGQVIRNVVSRYQQWAKDTNKRNREKPMAVSVEPKDAAVAFPASYLDTILWELINNHQKHAPDHPSTQISIRACANEDELTVVVKDESEVPKEDRTTQTEGYAVGQDAICRILRFMMFYDTHRKCLMDPEFGPDPSGLCYESKVRIDLARLPLRFAPHCGSAVRPEVSVPGHEVREPDGPGEKGEGR